MFMVAAGCSAGAAASFLVFQVERGATTNAVAQYVLAALLALVLPALFVVALRTLTPAKSFLAGALAWIAVAAGAGGVFLSLLFA